VAKDDFSSLPIPFLSPSEISSAVSLPRLEYSINNVGWHAALLRATKDDHFHLTKKDSRRWLVGLQDSAPMAIIPP